MKKKIIISVFIIVLIGIAVVAAILFGKQNNEEPQNTQVTTDAIPQLQAYYGDTVVCKIAGYTMDMKQKQVRDSIVPVSTGRQIKLEFLPNGNKINIISYEVVGEDEDRIIDSGNIENLQENEGRITCQYEVSAILKQGEEYYLKLNVQTDKHKKVNYYTRIMVENEAFVQNQIKFAKDFSDKTFDVNKAAELATYIEPDLKLANDDMGKVTIKSSYAMLTWNLLKPKKITDTQVTVKEICIKDTGEAGTYTLNYQIESTNAQKVKEKYNVSETITVWTYSDKQYVLAYNREVNQIWELSENNIGNSFIDLGIQNYSNAEQVESNNQQYIAFQVNGDVYSMDILQKKVSTIYRLNASDSEHLNRTHVKVIDVNDKGDVNYMIYGYSPDKNHVGKNGISIMEYSASNNESIEVAFIPCDVPGYILDNNLSQLFYVGDGTLYIMLEDTVYYTNLKTKEWGTLVRGLEEGNYAVSSDGATLSYNTDQKEYSDSITVVDLSSGEKKEISAGDGNKVTVCGYTGRNMVYGIGKASDIEKYNFFPMNKLKIVDENLKEIKYYTKDNIYITGVEISDTIINIKRWKKGKQISDDQLLDNTEKKAAATYSSYYNDDKKQKELAIAFTSNLDANTELGIVEQGKVIFDSSVEVVSKFEENNQTKYYVYGYGSLRGICKNDKDAIALAKENCGLVTNENGVRIWIFEENYK